MVSDLYTNSLRGSEEVLIICSTYIRNRTADCDRVRRYQPDTRDRDIKQQQALTVGRVSQERQLLAEPHSGSVY